ncbi:MAG: RidA family protein [Woeseia sp.]
MNIDRHETVSDQFSRIVIHERTGYFAGLVTDKPDSSFVEQCQDVLAKLDRLLTTAGTARRSLLSVTVYLKSFEDYESYRATWAAWIDLQSLPARATVQADLRDPRLLIEVQAIAALEDDRVR